MIGRTLALAVVLLVGCQGEPRHGVTSLPVFVADPASYDFGSVVVGESGLKSILVSADEDEDVSISATACAGFMMSLPDGAVTVGPSTNYQLDVTFAPGAAGAYACDLTFSGTITGDQVVNLVGVGVVAGPVATLVAPTNGVIAFGEVQVNVTSAVQPIEIRNDGTAALTFSSAQFASGGDDLAVTSASADTIAPGESKTWDVTCTRTANGDTGGTYQIAHDDPNQGPIAIAITCTGVTRDVYATPVPAVFGEVLVGGSRQLELVLHNDGSVGDTVASVQVTDDGPGSFVHDLADSTAVAASGTATFHVTFTPDADGEVTGTVTITMQSTITVNVALSGSGATAILSISPPDPLIELGTTCVGGQTEHVQLAVRNAGTGEFIVTGMEFNPLYPFTGIASAPTPLPPGGVVELPVEMWFQPTEAGDRTGEFWFHTTIPDDPLHILPLHGRGLEAEVGVTEDEHDFGAVEVGELSSAEDLGVLNCTIGSVTVSVALEGDDAAAFQILPGDPTSDVAVGTGVTTTWSVLFEPTRAGAHTASLVITWADGSAEVPLAGFGFEDMTPDPDDPDDDGRGSYLACSTGGPSGLMPLLLALLVIVRSRRRPW